MISVALSARCHARLSARRQRGVALISVLLVVAIATTLAASIISRQSLALHRTGNHLDQEQALQYALGGEELARQILHEDFEEDAQKDYLGEPWAAPFDPFDFEEGEVRIRITDLQGLFNLNSLAVAGGQGAVNHARFVALLNGLGIDSTLADRVADWVDADQTTRPAGAEDYDYLGEEIPHRTPSGPMADRTELRMLLDLDEQQYLDLLSYVTVLPDASAPLNLNTAPPVILQTIATDLSLGAAEVMVEQRDADGGYQSVTDFLQLSGVTGATGIQSSGLGVTSEYFRVDVQARFHARVATLSSVIQRDSADGSMRVIARDLGRTVVFTEPEPVGP